VAGQHSLLPLDVHRLRRVAVLGANAAVARTLGGGSATVFPPYTVSPLDGLRAALGPDVTVRYSRGGRISSRVPVADPALLRRPDGQPGTRIRFLAADGTELGREDRTGAGYKWMSAAGDGIALRDVATLEVHTDSTHRGRAVPGRRLRARHRPAHRQRHHPRRAAPAPTAWRRLRRGRHAPAATPRYPST
jgi:beta-glucosidase